MQAQKLNRRTVLKTTAVKRFLLAAACFKIGIYPVNKMTSLRVLKVLLFKILKS